MNGRADFREPSAEVPRPVPHIGADYIPTEEEQRLFKDCSDESFWFRSVMLITQGLISKGILSSHPKYGSIPKLACSMGYFAGKLFYVKTCQEKFKNLEPPPPPLPPNDITPWLCILGETVISYRERDS
uniref:OCIA domain-containing protein 1 n=1 Tax=Cricetulus griseus TaxID=10029 RepID=A0A8C2MVE9_CRIGR